MDDRVIRRKNPKVGFITMAFEPCEYMPLIYHGLCGLPNDIEWQWCITWGPHSAWGNFKEVHVPITEKQVKLRAGGLRTPMFAWMTTLGDPRVRVRAHEMWPSAENMLQAAFDMLDQDTDLFFMVDSDEVWQPRPLYNAIWTMIEKQYDVGMFVCRYYVGSTPRGLLMTLPKVSNGRLQWYGNRDGEWIRAWWYSPCMKIQSAAPPMWTPYRAQRIMDKWQALDADIVFDHYAYVSPVAYLEKLRMYNRPMTWYTQWRKAQDHFVGPAKASDLLPWVGEADECWVTEVRVHQAPCALAQHQ